MPSPIRLSSYKLATGACALALATVTCSCDRLGPPKQDGSSIPRSAADATKLCVDDATVRGVRALLVDDAGQPGSMELAGARFTRGDGRSLQVRVNGAVLEKFDADTLRTQCSGELQLSVGSAHEALRAHYSIQPTADRKGFVYTVGPRDEVEAALNGVLSSVVVVKPDPEPSADGGGLRESAKAPPIPPRIDFTLSDGVRPGLDAASIARLSQLKSDEALDDAQLDRAFQLKIRFKDQVETAAFAMGGLSERLRWVDERYLVGEGSSPPAAGTLEGAGYVLDTKTGGVVVYVDAGAPGASAPIRRILVSDPATLTWFEHDQPSEAAR